MKEAKAEKKEREGKNDRFQPTYNFQANNDNNRAKNAL